MSPQRHERKEEEMFVKTRDVISPDRHTNWHSNISSISVAWQAYHAVMSVPFKVVPDEFPAMSKIGPGTEIATSK